MNGVMTCYNAVDPLDGLVIGLPAAGAGDPVALNITYVETFNRAAYVASLAIGIILLTIGAVILAIGFWCQCLSFRCGNKNNAKDEKKTVNTSEVVTMQQNVMQNDGNEYDATNGWNFNATNDKYAATPSYRFPIN